MIKKMLFSFLSFLPVIVFSQGYFQSDFFLSKVVMIFEKDTGKTNSGSGFILKKNDSYFIVSAQHVTKSFSEKSLILYSDQFPQKTAKAKYRYLKNIVDTKKQFIYNSKDADVSLIKLSLDSLKKYGINFEKNSVQYDMLNTKLEDIKREYGIMIFGYPIYDINHFSPISFNSHVSSTLIPIYDSLTSTKYFVYYLENPSMQGCSGGPAIAGFGLGYTPEKPLLIGIVHGTVYDSTGGKYASIVPSYYIVKLVLDNKF